ncbi:hypothetical protein [Streptomyces sp. NBC_00996]|uniref:hypothetical protein n=1 Tax=Streptomyces sp. NBC_00996 TaxID=2903710 RepID=UPI00386E95E0|nr:hypothetical protein OG390_07050 [Streptomyces sp. NBC_00996]
MLGVLINLLPFWVREPLFVALGIPFTGFLFYAVARDGEPLMAALGIAVLAFTALRVYTMVRLLRARRPAQDANGA